MKRDERAVVRYLNRIVVVKARINSIEKDRFSGTCYKAANFHYIGTTQGRGRQDSANKYELPVRDIYLYPLNTDTRNLLCKGQDKEVIRLRSASDWAEEEFWGADLGDFRLTNRFRGLSKPPQSSKNSLKSCQNLLWVFEAV